MISLLYIAILILGEFLIYTKTKRVITIATIFLFSWTLLPLISIFNVANMYSASSRVHTYVFLGIFSYLVSYITVSKKINRSKLNIQQDYRISFERIYNSLNIISFIVLTPYLYKAIIIAKNSGFDYLRNIATTNSIYLINSTYLHLIISWIILPLFIVNLLILVLDIFIYKRTRTNIVLYAVFGVVYISLIFAARATIVKFIMFIVFAVAFKGFKSISRKQRRKILVFSVIPIILVVGITLNRTLSSLSFIENFLVYYGAPLPMLEHYFNYPSFSEIDLHTYGGVTFGFIYNTIYSIISLLFGVEYNGTDHLVSMITSQTIIVGDVVRVNAIPTSIYYFYKDFGVFGIIFGFSFIGFVSGIIERKTYESYTPFLFSLLVYFSYIVFKTFQNYEMISPQFFFVVFFSLVFLGQRKIVVRRRFT